MNTLSLPHTLNKGSDAYKIQNIDKTHPCQDSISCLILM